MGNSWKEGMKAKQGVQKVLFLDLGDKYICKTFFEMYVLGPVHFMHTMPSFQSQFSFCLVVCF